MRNLLLLLFLIPVLSTGCATVRMYPQRTADPRAEAADLNASFTVAKYFDLSGNPEGQRIYRNDLINARILDYDLNFEKFQESLVREGALTNLASEWAVMALTGASAVVPLAQTKTVLSAISTGIEGAKGSLDKNLFFKKTIVALVTQMKADRKTMLLAIREKMQENTDKYPLTAALIDLEEYYKAGTLPQALTSISVTAGATIKEKNEKLEKILTGKYLKDPAGVLLLKFWKPDGKEVNKDNEAALLIWLQKNGVKDADIPFIPFFIQTAQYSTLRAKAVEDLQLK